MHGQRAAGRGGRAKGRLDDYLGMGRHNTTENTGADGDVKLTEQNNFRLGFCVPYLNVGRHYENILFTREKIDRRVLAKPYMCLDFVGLFFVDL